MIEPSHLMRGPEQMRMLNFRNGRRIAPMAGDLLVTMMMLLMMFMWRSLRRCGRHEHDRKQQRGENGSHATSPSNSQQHYAPADPSRSLPPAPSSGA